MRTTVSLEDEVYEKARLIAFESKKTLGEVINSLLKKGLESSNKKPRKLGEFAGCITIADDFDVTPEEVLQSMDSPL